MRTQFFLVAVIEIETGDGGVVHLEIAEMTRTVGDGASRAAAPVVDVAAPAVRRAARRGLFAENPRPSPRPRARSGGQRVRRRGRRRLYRRR